MNIVKEGVAFGVGSEMGHRLVRMFTGATVPATAATAATNVVDKTDYSKCIERGSETRLCMELYGDEKNDQ
jgi:hypothetical protein